MKPIVNCQNQTDDYIVHNELFLDVYYEDILIIIHPKNQTKKIKPFFRQKQNAYFAPIYNRYQMTKHPRFSDKVWLIKIGRNLVYVYRKVILTHDHIRKGHIWGNQLYLEIGCLCKYTLRKLGVFFELRWQFFGFFMKCPNFLGSQFLQAQISQGPDFLGTKKVREPNEIGDLFSYSQSW